MFKSKSGIRKLLTIFTSLFVVLSLFTVAQREVKAETAITTGNEIEGDFSVPQEENYGSFYFNISAKYYDDNDDKRPRTAHVTVTNTETGEALFDKDVPLDLIQESGGYEFYNYYNDIGEGHFYPMKPDVNYHIKVTFHGSDNNKQLRILYSNKITNGSDYPDYVPSIVVDNMNLDNMAFDGMSFTKYWDDLSDKSKRPTNTEFAENYVKVLENGEDITDKVEFNYIPGNTIITTITDENGQEKNVEGYHYYLGLKEGSTAGKTYKITESKIDGYAIAESEEFGPLKNTSRTSLINKSSEGRFHKIELTKDWYDNSDRDKKRPTTEEYKDWLVLYKGAPDDPNRVEVQIEDPITITIKQHERIYNRYIVTIEGLDDAEQYYVEERPEKIGYFDNNGEFVYGNSGYEAIAETGQESHGGVYGRKVETESYRQLVSFKSQNLYYPRTIDIAVLKIWDDNDDALGVRPEKISVSLLGNGNVIDTIDLQEEEILIDGTADGRKVKAYVGKFWNKYVNDRDGTPVTYTIQELTDELPSEYISTVISGPFDEDQFGGDKDLSKEDLGGRPGAGVWTLKNTTYTIKNSVEEIPEDPTVTTKVSNKEVEAVDGQQIVDIITLNNLVKDREYTITGRLIDKESGEEIAATSSPIKFTATSETEEQNMTFQFDASALVGKEIVVFEVLSWDEDGETKSVGHEDPNDADQTFTVVEGPVEKVSVYAQKIWEDDNNSHGYRPSEITINLLKNGEIERTAKANEANDWSVAFEDLDKYEGEVGIEYTVDEEPIGNGYELVGIEQKSKDDVSVRFEITNEYDDLWNQGPVAVYKVDENGKPLKGAQFKIVNADGDTVAEWTSDGEAFTTYLRIGEYTLTEVSAPQGYKVITDITFKVEDTNGKVTLVKTGETTVTANDNEITVTNKPEEVKPTPTPTPPTPSRVTPKPKTPTAVPTPYTGDNTNLSMYIGLLVIAMGGVLFSIKKSKIAK